MTWAGESDAGNSGLYVFTDDGSPDQLVGTPGQLVSWDETGPCFVPQASITGVEPASINQIGDVDLELPAASGEVLEYDGSRWSNKGLEQLLNQLPYFNAYDSTGGVNVSNIATVVLDTIREENVGGAFTLAAGEITVNRSSVYKITFDCTLDLFGNQRTQAASRLELNGVEIAGTRRFQYVRRNYNTSMSASLIIRLTAGDVLRIRATRVGGGSTLVTEPDGSAITIEWKGP